MDLEIRAYAEVEERPEFITLQHCFFEWRKHYGLNNWIVAREKYKYRWSRRSFLRLLHQAQNWILRRDFPWYPSLRLSMSDLDTLEADIKSGGLMMVTGLHLAASIENDLAFVTQARAELLAGKVVLIMSDW